MAEQIFSDVRFHTDAEGMTIVCHDKLQKGAQYIAGYNCDHNREESPVHLARQHIVKCAAGNQRECQINGRDQHGTSHVDGKQLLMVAKIAQKNHQRLLPLVVFCGHKYSLLSLSSHYTQKVQSCKRNSSKIVRTVIQCQKEIREVYDDDSIFRQGAHCLHQACGA